MEVICGSEETPLSTIRPFGMREPPSGALNMSGSPYLIIHYLLRIEYKELGVIVLWLVCFGKRLRIDPRCAWHM